MVQSNIPILQAYALADDSLTADRQMGNGHNSGDVLLDCARDTFLQGSSMTDEDMSVGDFRLVDVKMEREHLYDGSQELCQWQGGGLSCVCGVQELHCLPEDISNYNDTFTATCTARALTNLDMFVLEAEDFHRLADHYPRVFKELKLIAIRCDQQHHQVVRLQVLPKTCHVFKCYQLSMCMRPCLLVRHSVLQSKPHGIFARNITSLFNLLV